VTDAWYDDEAGPLVRPFARPRRRRPAPTGLDMADLLVAAPESDVELTGQQADAVRRCARPACVAEVAAHLGLPIGEAQALLGGLVDAGALVVCATADAEGVLSVLDGLRGL
jgi:Protein of unknown function (DUF742)